MENGLDSMKAIADYITVSNQENGVAKAMEKFVLRSKNLLKNTKNTCFT